MRVLKGEIAKGQTTLVKATIGALKEKSSLVSVLHCQSHLIRLGWSEHG